tara:strand:- start:77 stop:607 length:531 start_codon:yes stop_codon:yes gene_type:complete
VVAKIVNFVKNQTRQFLTLCLLFAPIISFGENTIEHDINKVLDEFHAAAAKADTQSYLNYLTKDAVFLGTDEWERWPKFPDFNAYVKKRFKDGSGWNYIPDKREIKISQNKDIAWFDEVIISVNNNRFRGTGVLIKSNDKWKIAHYALSFLIFNEDWEEVVRLTKERQEKNQKIIN